MLKNGLYNVGSAILRLALSIVTVPLLIRLMGVETYGMWAMVTAVMGLVTLAEAGMSMSTSVFVSQDLAKGDIRGLGQTLTVTVSAMFILATLAAIGLFASAGLFSYVFPDLTPEARDTMTQAIRISAIVVWTQLMQRIMMGVEQAYQRYGALNAIISVQTIFTSLGMVAVAANGGGLVGLVSWYALTGAGGLLAHMVITSRLLPLRSMRPTWDGAKSRAILRYSVLTWITSIGRTLFSQGDRVIVGRLLGPAVLGVYAAITSITFQINALSSLPVQPFLPILSGMWAKQAPDRVALGHRLRQAYEISAFMALGLGAALVWLAPLVLAMMSLIVAGPGDTQYVLAFQLAVFIYALYSLNAVGYFVLQGIKAVQVSTLTVMAGGVLALVLIAAGAQTYGLMGAIVGNVGYILTLLLNPYGLGKLGVSRNAWLKWLRFPILWFVVSVALCAFVDVSMELRLLLFMPQALVLGAWFAYSQTAMWPRIARRGVAR